MKFLLSVSFFALATTVVHAGPGSSTAKTALREVIPNTSRYVSRTYARPGRLRMDKNIYSSSPHTQKRFNHATPTQLKTRGFRPEKPVEVTQLHTLDLPTKLEYLDETYEVFRTPPGFQNMLEESLKRSHTKASSIIKEEKKK